MSIASDREIQANVTKMGPAVLPLSEKLLFALNWMARRLPGGRGIKPYIPDFRRAFDHFCLHAGGPLPAIPLLAHWFCFLCAQLAHIPRLGTRAIWSYHPVPHFCAVTAAAKARPAGHQIIQHSVCCDQMVSYWLTVRSQLVGC